MPKRRKATRTNASTTLLVLVVLFILGAYYSLTGRDSDGSLAPATQTSPAPTQPSPVVSAPTAVNASGIWWEVYFTDPVNINNPADWQSSVAGRLVEKINAAQTSIHIASF